MLKQILSIHDQSRALIDLHVVQIFFLHIWMGPGLMLTIVDFFVCLQSYYYCDFSIRITECSDD